MSMERKRPVLYLLLVAALITCTLSKKDNSGNLDTVTRDIVEILDELQDSHGETTSQLLNVLQDLVDLQNITAKAATSIRDVVTAIDDPKTREILDVIDGVLPQMSMDELLFSAFDVFDDLSKSGGDREEDEKPKLQFAGDGRTYVVSELDLLIPEEEIDNHTAGRFKRKAVIDEERLLWKSGVIPYHIVEEQFSSADRHGIKNAMDHWEDYTCLVFRERKADDFNSLLIHSDGRGCFSNAGQIGGTQHLVLGPSCKMLKIIIHELGHTIGLYHEHTRTDRDTYIEILWENIMNIRFYLDFWMRPDKHRIEDVVPYDYHSIMHYGSKYWGKKSKRDKKKRLKTIKTKDQRYQDIIGRTSRASYIDIKTVSTLYRCSEGCKPKKCPGDGFQGKRCECWCRGPDENTPVVRCEKEVSCPPPDIDMRVYQVFHYETPEQIIAFTMDIPSGTKFRVDRVDLRCGDAMTEIMCSHGVWDLPLPPCEPDPCYVDAQWPEVYDLAIIPPETSHEDILQLNVTHGSRLILTCKSEQEREKVIECSYGNWTGQPQLCPEIGGRCLITNDSYVSFIDSTGGELQAGDTVKHLDNIRALCIPELIFGTDYYQDEMETNMTCLDGRWLGYLPICPEPPVECPEVSHGQKVTYLPLWYNVTCDAGYQLEIERDYFYCDRNGTWFPATPVCLPKDCVIPQQYTFRGVITNADGIVLSQSVRSGNTVGLQCIPGFAPGRLDLTCNAGRWNTVDGSLPICTEVFCHPRPPVQKSSYSPHLPHYRFGDVVTINKCPGNLEQVGPSQIECLADGSWSASFQCRKFCDGGEINEVQFSNQIVRAKPVKSLTSVASRKACQKKCKKQKRFLCLSYLYGFDEEKWKWICNLYRINPSSNLLEYRYMFYVFVRSCIE